VLCHEDVFGSGGIDPPLLILALDGGEWPASCPATLLPGKELLVHIGKEAGWALRASLGTGEEKNLLPLLTVQHVACRCTN
jgi:hypothetical protein